MQGELFVPISDEFLESVWQLVNELIVQVEPIVGAIVPYYGYLGFDDGFDHQREAKFICQQLLFWVVRTLL